MIVSLRERNSSLRSSCFTAYLGFLRRQSQTLRATVPINVESRALVHPVATVIRSRLAALLGYVARPSWRITVFNYLDWRTHSLYHDGTSHKRLYGIYRSRSANDSSYQRSA